MVKFLIIGFVELKNGQHITFRTEIGEETPKRGKITVKEAYDIAKKRKIVYYKKEKNREVNKIHTIEYLEKVSIVFQVNIYKTNRNHNGKHKKAN